MLESSSFKMYKTNKQKEHLIFHNFKHLISKHKKKNVNGQQVQRLADSSLRDRSPKQVILWFLTLSFLTTLCGRLLVSFMDLSLVYKYQAWLIHARSWGHWYEKHEGVRSWVFIGNYRSYRVLTLTSETLSWNHLEKIQCKKREEKWRWQSHATDPSEKGCVQLESHWFYKLPKYILS